MDKKKIERINELTRLSRERELTDEEKAERQELRKDYIEAIKLNFRSTLDNIELK